MNCSILTASSRSLGSGTFSKSIDVTWNVEEPIHRYPTTRLSAPNAAVAGTTSNQMTKQLEYLHNEELSMLSSKDLCLSRRESMAWTEASASTDSLCSTDEDDGVLSQGSGKLSATTTEVPLKESDVYGQRHPIESRQLLEEKLIEFDEAVACLSGNETVHIAGRRCPELLTSNFKLMFLRCECFKVQLAVQRYCKYWDKRLDVFGEKRAFAKLTVSSMMDDMVPLQLGALQVLRRPPAPNSSKDERDILYMDSSKLQPGAYTRESGCRAFWYIMHSLLEDEQVQKRGLIVLMFSANLKSSNRDPGFTRMCLSSMQGCLPIRASAFHNCHAPLLFHLLAKMLLPLIGERLRKRILSHAGKYDKVVDTLTREYGLQKSIIPSVMGGDLTLNQQAWLDERKAAGL